jgi:hypothetical protein
MEDFIYLEPYILNNPTKNILFLKGIKWTKLPNIKMNGYYSYIDEDTWKLINIYFFKSHIPKLELLTKMLNEQIISLSLKKNNKGITEDVYSRIVDSVNLYF